MSGLARVSRTLVPRSVRMFSSSAACRDTPTHTGQTYAEDDVRNVRFDVTGLRKQTNTEWAIDLIAKVPVIKVNARVISCDGGGGALGHPRVFINLDQAGPHSCIYCGLRYEMEHHH